MRCCHILPGGHNIINPESNLGRRKTLIDADKSKNQRFHLPLYGLSRTVQGSALTPALAPGASVSVQNKVLERSHLEDYFGVSHV